MTVKTSNYKYYPEPVKCLEVSLKNVIFKFIFMFQEMMNWYSIMFRELGQRPLSAISWESITMVTEPNGRQWKHLDKVGSYNGGII